MVPTHIENAVRSTPQKKSDLSGSFYFSKNYKLRETSINTTLVYTS